MSVLQLQAVVIWLSTCNSTGLRGCGKTGASQESSATSLAAAVAGEMGER